jgi:hypothetical protein
MSTSSALDEEIRFVDGWSFDDDSEVDNDENDEDDEDDEDGASITF